MICATSAIFHDAARSWGWVFRDLRTLSCGPH
ncbi:hypothetical protein RD1_2169 [Roseobacter denitrificans OCh 114]|uniref:Uncharacterized protein n=1 Tax=Roseobacter denitrificans (strain ATCC 33942 / OCh 114) TaxID=375451 RepID=Q167S9_ROSDO|nr:hypothetical protein RD1_2169 [Roseobacter denitrificans OCh 114]